MRRIASIIFCFLLLLGIIFSISEVVYSSTNEKGIKEKIALLVEKQREIDIKLKEIEKLLHEVKLRVYRKTGF